MSGETRAGAYGWRMATRGRSADDSSGSNCCRLSRELSSHPGMAAEPSCRRMPGSRSQQQRLYLLPLPQEQAWLRPNRGGSVSPAALLPALGRESGKVKPTVACKSQGPLGGLRFAASPRLGRLAAGLLAPQRQQLGIGGEDLGHRIFELAALLYQGANLLHQLLRHMLHVLFAVDHEGERPDGVTLALGAATVGFSAADVGEGERAGQRVGRDLEAAQEGELALALARGLISFGVVPFHLHVILQ